MNKLYCINLGMGGRLGNQLFHIAATIGQALKFGMLPQIPASWKYRQHFNIPDEYFTDAYPRAGKVYKEAAFHYTPLDIDNSRDGVLEGYFQSYKYWDGYEDQIRQYLTPKGCKPGIFINHVALHYRRGDYVNNINYAQLTHSYYVSAFDYYFSDYEIMAFSDDSKYLQGVHGNKIGSDDIADFKLMVNCLAHIVSNSTFSWWAAYLADCITVRPDVYFAGPLSNHDTKDFWPSDWIEHKSCRTTLPASIIIPVQFDHINRLENLQAVLKHITAVFDCEIIVGEIDTHKFADLAAQYGCKYMHFAFGAFHRTKALNEMTKAAANEIVFNYDADVFLSPWQLLEAVRRMQAGADIVYPYDGCFYWCPRTALAVINRTNDVANLGGHPWRRVGATPADPNSYGGVVGYNRTAFFKAGGENEMHVSYSNEDFERWWRFNLLGLDVQRVDGPLYHIDHYRGINSGELHANGRNNRHVWATEQQMTAKQLQNFINSEKWNNGATLSDMKAFMR